jgi:sialic acid synthase SpsE|tara:strand:- start:4347 stop:5324 length:978 start_codon:yes stop_codon:yes gene_type:complete
MNKTLIIGEAGINHNGDFNKAKRLIDIAKYANVDCVKFQLFDPKNIVNKDIKSKKYNFKKIYKRFASLQFKINEWKKIVSYARKKRIKIFFSVFDINSYKLLKKFKINIVKIPSGEINNIPLLEEINKSKPRVILSTGMSNMKEISLALTKLKNCHVQLLHCTSEYPNKKPNLLLIKKLKQIFKKEIGFSDHSIENVTPALAVMMGAKIIEKHFTYNKKQKFGDHKMSLDPLELKRMVEFIRFAENSIGNGKKIVSTQEKQLQSIARKGIYLNKPMKKNEKIKMQNLSFLRPVVGLQANQYKLILDKKLNKNLKKNKPLNLRMFK